jgi:CelD/BcsL family acetyltransferase involved in cellulose biosynthesis
LGGPVCADDDACAALLSQVMQYLRQAGSGAALVAVGPADAASPLWESPASAGHHVVYDEGAVNSIDCGGEFDAYYSALSKNFRNNLRKARNKLAKLEDVRVVSATLPGEVEHELEAFIRLEGAGWKGSAAGGEALCLNASNVEFFRELFVGLAASGRSEINALYVGDRCIAGQLCVHSGDVYEMYKIAYDEAFAPQAPGQMLFEHTLKRCFADPILAQVDLMSDTPWHYDWLPTRTSLRRGYFSAGSVVGRLLLVMVRLRFGPVRRLVRSRARRRATG